MRPLREAVRGVGLSVLGTAGAFYSTPRALRRPRVQFLYFHQLPPEDEESFARLLEFLAPGHEFLPYGEAVRRAVEGPIDRPYIAFSFDDAFQSCLRAAELLEAYGARACFFVPTRIIGETSPEAIEAFSVERLNKSGVEFMSWEDLAELKDRGHEVGGHTHNHVNVAELTVDEARREIDLSFSTLADRLGEPDHFAWPYGRFRHFTAAGARAVWQAGFRSCASAEPGVHLEPVGEPRSLCVHRRHMHAWWPHSHQSYLAAASVRRSNAATGSWPPGWSSAWGAGS